MRLAVIVLLRDRADTIEQSLLALAELRRRGHFVIVVGGASAHCSSLQAHGLADRVVVASQRLSLQLNAASRVSEAESADAFVFLPEAVRLPARADRTIARALSNCASPWGCFSVDFCHARKGRSRPLRLAAALANGCARATGICLWEQAIFVSRSAFLALQGFAAEEESADIEFSRRARELGAPIVVRDRALVCATEPSSLAVLRAILRRERRRLAGALGWQLRGNGGLQRGPV